MLILHGKHALAGLSAVVAVALVTVGCTSPARPEAGASTGQPAPPKGAAATRSASPGTAATSAGSRSAGTPFATLNHPADDGGEPGAGVTGIAFSATGTALAGSDWAGVAYQWNLATGRITATMAGPGSKESTDADSGNAMALSPSGTTLAFGGGDAAGPATWLFDVATSRLVATLPSRTGNVASVAFSPNGATLAVATENGTISLWNAAGQRLIGTLSDPAGNVNAISFSPSGATLAVADLNGARLFDVATGRVTATLTDPAGPAQQASSGPFVAGTNGLAFSPSGATLALADGDGDVNVWAVASARLLKTLTAPGQGGTSTAKAVAFSPSGTTLAADGGPGVYLWDVSDSRLAGTLDDPAPDAPLVTALAFSLNGKTLAAADSDGSIYLWHTA